MTTDPVRWRIIGPGSIAKAFAGGVDHSRTGELVAIATRDPNRPGLATDFPGARILDGYDAMLADPGVDAIYIATPHPGHDYPVTESFSLTLAQDGDRFQLHVFAENPNGTLFVPRVTEVTRGFLQVPKAQWAALGKQLQAAQAAPGGRCGLPGTPARRARSSRAVPTSRSRGQTSRAASRRPGSRRDRRARGPAPRWRSSPD